MLNNQYAPNSELRLLTRVYGILGFLCPLCVRESVHKEGIPGGFYLLFLLSCVTFFAGPFVVAYCTC